MIRGIGPKGMNLGISNNVTEPQQFTLFYLLSFSDNKQTTHNDLFKSWANTHVNKGINIFFNASEDKNRDTYTIIFTIEIVDKIFDLEPIIIDKTHYYLLSIGYFKGIDGFTVDVYIHEINLYENNVLQNSSLTSSYPTAIDFSNKQIEFGSIQNTQNPVGILAFGVYNKALKTKNVFELASYYLNILQKTSKSALNLYALFFDMKTCPLEEDA